MKSYLLVSLLLFSAQSLACSVIRDKEPSIAERYEEASTVVLARIVSASLKFDPDSEYPGGQEYVDATIEAIEYFKGDALDPPVVRETVFGPGNCMLGLLVGNYYLFFLYEGQPYVGWPGGSFMTWNIEGTEVVPVLEELRELGRTSN